MHARVKSCVSGVTTTDARTLVLVAALAMSPGIAGAGDTDFDTDRDAEIARDLVAAGRILPLSEVLQAAMREQPGRVIEVDLDSDDGRHVYEFEIVDAEGRVWELELDAATAALIDRELEDD